MATLTRWDAKRARSRSFFALSLTTVAVALFFIATFTPSQRPRGFGPEGVQDFANLASSVRPRRRSRSLSVPFFAGSEGRCNHGIGGEIWRLRGGKDAEMKPSEGPSARSEYTPGQIVILSDDETLKKEVIKCGEGNEVPKRGDTVFVHYVGKLEDGTVFDSSRERNEAFRFPVGRGRVIKGWDLGIATMRKGEIAKLTCPPLYAYGARGSPPKIPPEATLHFEVEILKWISGDDLTGDTGVMKKILVKGDKWQTPKEGDEVKFSWVGYINGNKFGSGEDVTATLGRSPMVEAFKKALLRMKKKEKSKLTVASDYAAPDSGIGSPPDFQAPEEIEYEITLHGWDPIDDISGDSGVLKKVVTKGEGWKTPKEGDEAQITFLGRTMDGKEYDRRENFTFIVGDGQIVSGLEKALMRMKKGENAQIKCLDKYAESGRIGSKEGASEMLFDVILERWSEISVIDEALGCKKKIVKEGIGYESPKDLGTATVSVTGVCAGNEFAKVTNKTFLLVAGEDIVPWGVEKAILTMKRGEEAIITLNATSALDTSNKPMYPDLTGDCEFHVVCDNFSKVVEPFELQNATDKVEVAVERKLFGNKFYMRDNYELANRHYSASYDILKDIDMKDTKDPAFQKANETRLAVTLNLAAARNELNKFSEVVPILSPILDLYPSHVKALYRRAQAYIGLRMYREAIKDAKKAYELTPTKGILNIHNKAVKLQKQTISKEKGVWSKALNGVLGNLYDDKPMPKPKPEAEGAKQEIVETQDQNAEPGDEFDGDAAAKTQQDTEMKPADKDDGGNSRIEELDS